MQFSVPFDTSIPVSDNKSSSVTVSDNNSSSSTHVLDNNLYPLVFPYLLPLLGMYLREHLLFLLIHN